MGVSVQRYGALNQWAIQIINIVTGNIDREGGSMFTLPAVDQVRNTGPGGFGRHRSRKRNLPEFDRELPSAALAEEITTPGEGQIKVLFTGAGNPVLSTPNGRQLDAALEQLDFMVSLDPYLNETTRHADIILPPTSPLEHDHYDLGFHVNALRNTTRFNQAVFEKPEGALHDWEIFVGLGERVAARLGLEAPKRIPPHMIIDAGIKGGPYGENSEHKLSLQSLIDNPSGVDLGELTALLPERLQTKDKRINCATPEPLSDLPRLLAEFAEQDDTAPFRLIGRRHVRDCNSWMHNYHRLVKGKNRCTLMMHPSDAASQGLSEGADVAITSRVGTITAPLEITDQVMPGVVSLPHGYGHDRKGIQMDIAIANKGVSCNDITDHEYLDDLSGNAAVNGVPVSVSAA
jgi:anaerobic selenocysteine-containing dehydrogenase